MAHTAARWNSFGQSATNLTDEPVQEMSRKLPELESATVSVGAITTMLCEAGWFVGQVATVIEVARIGRRQCRIPSVIEPVSDYYDRKPHSPFGDQYDAV
jgi:hypothetical protein